MRRSVISGTLLLIACVAVAGQAPVEPSAGEPPKFAAATLRRNLSGSERVDAQAGPGGRVAIIDTTIRDALRNAFGLASGQLAGGPDWLARERYDNRRHRGRRRAASATAADDARAAH